MKWHVDVDVIRSSGRELHRVTYSSLADAWAFVLSLAVWGDRFIIGKEDA